MSSTWEHTSWRSFKTSDMVVVDEEWIGLTVVKGEKSKDYITHRRFLMATTTSSAARTLAIAEIAENVCRNLGGKELAALASTSKSVCESALNVLWDSVKSLKNLFLLIPGCFEEDYCLVSTKSEFFFF